MNFIRALILLLFGMSAASRRPLTNKLLKSKVSPPTTKFESTTIVAATLEYKQKFGDLRIPVDYIVPADSQWPQELWNFDLGAQAQVHFMIYAVLFFSRPHHDTRFTSLTASSPQAKLKK